MSAKPTEGAFQAERRSLFVRVGRLPPFIALNEPESSLHPDLMEPLAEMICKAAERTQVWLVTHSERLANAIRSSGRGEVRTVTKTNGATTIEGFTLMGTFRDEDDQD